MKHRLWLRICLLFGLVLAIQSCTSWDHEYRLRFWERCRTQAQSAYFKHNYRKFLSLSKEAVRQAEGLGDADFHLAVSLSDLAAGYELVGKREEAIKVYMRALSLMEVLAKQSGSSVQHKLICQDMARVLQNMAQLYAVQGNHKQAISHFKWAISIYEPLCAVGTGKSEDNLVAHDLIRCSNGLAQVYCRTKNYTEAERYFLSAIERAQGAAYPELMLNDIRQIYGRLLENLGRQKEAYELFVEKRWTDYIYLGSTAMKQHDFAKAEIYFFQAVAEAEKIQGSKNRLIKSLLNLINLYAEQKRIPELELTSKKAISIYENSGNPVDCQALIDKIEIILATTYSATGRSVLAIPLLQKLLVDRAKLYGPLSLQAAEAQATLARDYLISGCRQEAKLNADQSFHTLKARFASDKRASLALSELGSVYEELAVYERAEEIYKIVHQLNQKLKDPWDYRTTSGLLSLCKLYHRMHRLPETKFYTEEMIRRMRQMPLQKQLDSSPYLVVIASTYFDGGSYDLAAQVYSELLRIKRDSNAPLPLNKKLEEELTRNVRFLERKSGKNLTLRFEDNQASRIELLVGRMRRLV